LSDPMNIGRPAVFLRPSNPMNIFRPAVFGQPAKAPSTGGFLRPTLKFPPTGLLPLESPPPQDLRPLRPRNSRLFFFSKP
jgi:hypothetical protein